ncbi:XAC2610-related protein [Marinimicrobium agarilyticum]|uniref:XAC2610-related protein n=1 Tax=Marinimicrobium agarilyticum TaxID=306546 RepID=UPI0004881D45|nr:hypothetical protein [Marinimicrobium agarilyticum]
MKCILLAFVSFSLCACAQPLQSSDNGLADNARYRCLFSFNGINNCSVAIDGHSIDVTLNLGLAEYDERPLTAIDIEIDGAKQELPLSAGVTIIEGDKGYVEFQDINFDGHRDLAITTSFGVANLYLDYWVFEADKNSFRYIGNFPELRPVPENKTLTSHVKLNAASYERQDWLWEDNELVRKP